MKISLRISTYLTFLFIATLQIISAPSFGQNNSGTTDRPHILEQAVWLDSIIYLSDSERKQLGVIAIMESTVEQEQLDVLSTCAKIGHVTIYYSDEKIDVKRTSTITNSLKQLPLLTTLIIHANGNSGFPDLFEGLNSVQFLKVRSTRIKVLPNSIWKLPALHSCVITADTINGFGDNFGMCPQLRYLSLFSKSCKSLPPSIGNFQGLWEFHFRSYDLTALPSEFYDLQSLREISLATPSLVSLDKDIAKLKHLHEFKLLLAYELKSLPKTFSSLENLERLTLTGAFKIKSLDEIVSCKSLKRLRLGGVDITPYVNKISELQKLEVFIFGLDGMIGKSLSPLVELNQLKAKLYASYADEDVNNPGEPRQDRWDEISKMMGEVKKLLPNCKSR